MEAYRRTCIMKGGYEPAYIKFFFHLGFVAMGRSVNIIVYNFGVDQSKVSYIVPSGRMPGSQFLIGVFVP